MKIKDGKFYMCRESFMQGRFTEGRYYFSTEDGKLMDNYGETVGVGLVEQYFTEFTPKVNMSKQELNS